MAQEVVRQENEEEPGQRTRLMVRNDVVGVLRGCLGIDSVRTIKCISNFEERMKLVRGEVKERVTVQLEAFRKMGNLRFIKLCDPYSLKWSCSSNDDMSCFAFKHLKYLEWEGFPCKSLDNFDMGNVMPDVYEIDRKLLQTHLSILSYFLLIFLAIIIPINPHQWYQRGVDLWRKKLKLNSNRKPTSDLRSMKLCLTKSWPNCRSLQPYQDQALVA
ncbi:hypothetical protein Tco_0752788 [Tanacetum coccineum]|uniref:Uncharacterized protein n=1 Tax=Tanacetum coccineum TaxID=301880 RepID=A0ABQ4ZB74_9ASTR